MFVTTGGWFAPLGATNVNAFESVAECPPDVTTTSAVPAPVFAPTTPVNAVEPWRTTLVAGTPPTVTVVPVAKLVPSIVMLVPPVGTALRR